MHRSVLVPPVTAIVAASSVFDADLDDDGNAAFAVGHRGAATHILFGTGALIALPKPLHTCTLRLRDRDRVLVRGWKKPPFLEPDAYEVASDGTIRQSFPAVQYCSGILCTQDRVVLTYYDDHMGVGIDHADQALAVFDWDGTYLWGWNDCRDLQQLLIVMAPRGWAAISSAYSRTTNIHSSCSTLAPASRLRLTIRLQSNCTAPNPSRGEMESGVS